MAELTGTPDDTAPEKVGDTSLGTLPDGRETPPARSHRLRRAIQGGLSLAIVAWILFVFVPSKVDLHEVAAALAAITALQWALLVAVAVYYVFAGAPLISSTAPGLGLGRGFLIYQVTTAVARIIPGGGALSPAIRYRFMRGWGFAGEFIAASLVSMSAVSAAVWMSLLVVSIVIAAIAGQGGHGLGVLAIVAALVLAGACLGAWWAIRSEDVAKGIGAAIGSVDARARRKPHDEQREVWGGRIVDLRVHLLSLKDRLPRAVAAATLIHLSGFVVVLASLRIVGVSNETIGWEWVLVAAMVGNILGSIPITPSGLGIADVGMAAVLGYGQSEETQALIVAALILYRAVTFLCPILTGSVCYFLTRHSLAKAAEARREVAVAGDATPVPRATGAG